jgi:hypothetical protein
MRHSAALPFRSDIRDVADTALYLLSPLSRFGDLKARKATQAGGRETSRARSSSTQLVVMTGA